MSAGTVLLAVDLQRGFCRGATEVMPRVRDRLAADGSSLLATRFVNSGPMFEQRLGWSSMRGGLDVELDPLIAQRAVRVFDKDGYGAPAELVDYLHSIAPTRIEVFGIDTDSCVLATAIALFDAHLPVVLNGNLSGSTGGERMHRYGLEVAGRMLGYGNLIGREQC